VQATSTVRDPHELIFGTQDLMMWQAYFEKNRKMEESLNDRIYSKRAWLLKNKNASKIESSEQLRVHNHFNANYFLGNKKALFYSMRKYYELNGQNVFDFLPLTFHIARGIDDPECAKFLKHYSQIQESNQQQPANRQIKNIWIVKPGEFTNRGTGITVCANLDDVKIRLKGRERNQNGKFRTFIVQKYL
jgi:tubulin polyglutamylase TTLL1